MATAKTGGAINLKYAKIDSLKRAKFNPKTRQKDIGRLADSIGEHGLVAPIVIDKQHNVIDGHRRLSACENLGWEQVPVVIAEGDQATLFAEVTSSVRPLKGNETLQVYLKEPRAIGSKARGRIKQCEEVVGRATIRALMVGGFSMATWDVARRLCEEADQVTPAKHRKVLLWLIKHKCAGAVEKALRDGEAVATIMNAVDKGRPIGTTTKVVAR